MTVYGAKCEINAPTVKVWDLITTKQFFLDHDPTVGEFRGEIARDAKIQIARPDQPGNLLSINVEVFEENQRMVWAGELPLGTFRSERIFKLTDHGDGTTTFDMKATFKGPLAGAIVKTFPDLTEPFREFALALKRAAEKSEA